MCGERVWKSGSKFYRMGGGGGGGMFLRVSSFLTGNVTSHFMYFVLSCLKWKHVGGRLLIFSSWNLLKHS